MSKYILRQKDDFQERTRGLPTHIKRIVNDKIENHIRERPYDFEELQYELSGLWSYNKMPTGDRIIFAICEDCRKKKWTIMNNCSDCQEIPSNTIILWTFGGHETYNQLRRTRSKAWHKAVKQKRRERGY